jgi:hypothetical protein
MWGGAGRHNFEREPPLSYKISQNWSIGFTKERYMHRWYNFFYLTLYTFSFEINESRLSDTRCLIQDVVSPHCGDKRMARHCMRRSLPNYFDMTSYHWNARQNTVTWRWWMNGKDNVTSYTKCSLPQEYCTYFNSTLAICLKFIFIEMLDKLITYIVWWYKTVYQVLSVVWTNRITIRRFRDS